MFLQQLYTCFKVYLIISTWITHKWTVFYFAFYNFYIVVWQGYFWLTEIQIICFNMTLSWSLCLIHPHLILGIRNNVRPGLNRVRAGSGLGSNTGSGLRLLCGNMPTYRLIRTATWGQLCHKQCVPATYTATQARTRELQNMLHMFSDLSCAQFVTTESKSSLDI